LFYNKLTPLIYFFADGGAECRVKELAKVNLFGVETVDDNLSKKVNYDNFSIERMERLC
jgi:hypothetical protein